MLCTVRDTSGNPIADAKIDVWETDSKGFYDVQYADRAAPEGRAVLKSDKDGRFWFKAIVPVPYPIPHDGPVGKLLKALKRHPYRPSHMHFMFEKSGFDHLITSVTIIFTLPSSFRVSVSLSLTRNSSLYLRGDPYETSDAVFGVKESLLISLGSVTAEQAKEYGVKEGGKSITYDFVLVSDDEARQLREDKAMAAMKAQGRKMKLYQGLPVPDVD